MAEQVFLLVNDLLDAFMARHLPLPPPSHPPVFGRQAQSHVRFISQV